MLEASTKFQGIVKKTYQAFFSPSQYDVKPKDREVIEWGNNYRIPCAGEWLLHGAKPIVLPFCLCTGGAAHAHR
jgi:hypothetical protein